MDYKEKYEQVLERARKLYENSNGMILKKWLWNIFPELKELEDEDKDEKIRKALIDYLKERKSCESYGQYILRYDRWIAWLEKHGEHKSANKVEPKDYSSIDPHFGKPINKPELKFHEGDWVVYNNDICQIVKREEGCNKLVTIFGIEKELVNERNLSTAHLWTIQVAKDGDVLSDGTTIFIFKDLLSDGSVMSYCDYDTDSGESDAFCPLSMNLMCSKITPATKEQRDTLMKAMADAGYTFYFEKKELRKIIDEKQIKKNIQDNSFRRMFEQKPAWSKEDEKEVAVLEAYIRTKNWNEKRIDRALGIVDELVNKVKSLIPQTTWKPSEEQIKALEWQVANTSKESWQGKATKELLEQLKNLSLNIKV